MVKFFTKKRLKTGIIVTVFVFLFCVLFVLSAMGGLRFFIPNYFEIAGGPFSEKSYLLTFQDENQLTPSGGAVTKYGIIKFTNSMYAGFEKKDIPLFINSEPDFPKSVSQVLEAVNQAEAKTSFDGIIAVNSGVIDETLNVIGSERLKNIFFSPLSWREVSDIIVRNLNEKNIQLYFFNNGLQKKIEEKGWSGRWPIANGDFIAVVDSNTSGNNINGYIKRNIDYRLNLSNAQAHLIINIENFASDDAANLYNDIIKIYLAPGTVLQKSTSLTLPEKSLDYAVYSTKISLKPGERKTIDCIFKLTPEILNISFYHLDIVKQSGTKGDHYSVIVESPENWTPLSNDFEITGNTAIWEGFLYKDTQLNFSITKKE